MMMGERIVKLRGEGRYLEMEERYLGMIFLRGCLMKMNDTETIQK